MTDPTRLYRASGKLDQALTSPDPERPALVRQARDELNEWLEENDAE